MLVNNASDLQSINTDVTRPDAYALGRDINASSIANFTPLGTLNTIFEGQGYTISNLKIRGLHDPERWVVQQHRQHWRGPQPQPDRCRSERPKLPICWRAGGNERRNNQQHLRYWNSASGQRKHHGRPGWTESGLDFEFVCICSGGKSERCQPSGRWLG